MNKKFDLTITQLTKRGKKLEVITITIIACMVCAILFIIPLSIINDSSTLSKMLTLLVALSFFVTLIQVIRLIFGMVKYFNLSDKYYENLIDKYSEEIGL